MLLPPGEKFQNESSCSEGWISLGFFSIKPKRICKMALCSKSNGLLTTGAHGTPNMVA